MNGRAWEQRLNQSDCDMVDLSNIPYETQAQRKEREFKEQLNSITVKEIKMPHLYLNDFFTVNMTQKFYYQPQFFQYQFPLMPILADFFLDSRIKKEMFRYKDCLSLLNNAYHRKHRTAEDYKNAIMNNEDGFFLRLYSVIRESQIIVSCILNESFLRQRQNYIYSSGGIQNCQVRRCVRMLSQQNEIKQSIMDLIYQNAFEYFDKVDEKVFAKKVQQEMEAVDQKLLYRNDRASIWQRYSANLFTTFMHIYITLEQGRKKYIMNNTVITRKMVFRYLDLLKNLRWTIRSLKHQRPSQSSSNHR